MQSNPISDHSFRNCPPVQDPWASCHEQGLLSALSLISAFLLRQAGWQGVLVHCQPWQSAVLCQLCLHSSHRSVLAGQNGLSQQQPHKPALCTQELNFPSLLEDLHYSSHAAGHRGLCSNFTPLQADPALCCWPCSILQDTSTLTFWIVSL